MLYMPASNARALEKARSVPADVLIFDLEDAVAPAAKLSARDAAVAAVRSKAYGARELLIRMNALDTPWAIDDVAAAAVSGADGVVLPKVNGAAEIERLDALLAGAGAPSTMAIWAMMETPRGILAAARIASASPRGGGLLIGTADLAKDLRCAHPRDRGTMQTSLQLCVLAARAHDRAVIDGVYFEVDDAPGFEAACRQGRDLGFDGKTLIHPNQVAVANAVFAPSQEELERARRIIDAHAQAAREGKGVTLLDGRLVEGLHVREAERLLAQAQAIAALAVIQK
jgi:citrate lyase subunit beta/citryl-CoA lyase